MAGSYTAGEQVAAKIGDAIADGASDVKIGVVTKATSSTTAVVTHGLTGAPDFVLCNVMGDAGATPLNAPALTINSTSVTFTISTAQTSWSVAYIMGYTA